MALDLSVDAVQLTEDLVNIESVSGNEAEIADAVEAALRPLAHLEVERFGHTIVARTHHGHAERVVIAGHLDTVPVNNNLPARRDEHALHGLGSADMKGGCAVALRLAATLPSATRDITYLFYDCEEVEAERNGLFQLSRRRPDLLEADFAILMEPSDAIVEAGCQGTMRVDVTVHGERAHAARSWMGSNAIHGAADVLARLGAYQPRRPVIDGLEYHEGLNAVFIEGGVAGNVLPDRCCISVNHRFAPDRSEAEALRHLREVFDGYDVEVSDSAPAAMPGLSVPAAAAFVEAVGGAVKPKFGWTDVARFSELGVPAVNFGPGDPHLAHKADEFVPVEHIRTVEERMRSWLLAGADLAPSKP
ncbi:MAG: N-succinyl-L,L-diaminopimelate desuccinylase [uncultured Nocardioidaceae bacterium]|uniref:Succinyl-diaminopimelate desuccinylase n=1 Tax=uncultured Nocardioidaceae bacterium TaxID=253824 RepID=A0A6J4LF29_9ACTN|nr:MAG: N-succinyl-L,L-diaminopimelate desuccinylase [uncultured Nocardioidaceae bacterium]